ncbi:MAG: barstar family protein [Burkholderiaceae bacterium]
MSLLSNIPQQAVLPLNAYDLPALVRAAEAADQVFLHADCSVATDKKSVMAAIGRDFRLPEHFGMNLDALYDCLTDLVADRRADKPGFLMVLEKLPDGDEFDAKSRNALLDVFRDAADFFDDHDTGFRVFYSVTK